MTRAAWWDRVDRIDTGIALEERAAAPSALEAGRFDAFISYSRSDEAEARALRNALAEHGHAVWIDLEGIAAGADWQRRIELGIEACTALVFLLTRRSLASNPCRQELEQADALKKLIVVVRLEDEAFDAVELPKEIVGLPSIGIGDESALQRLIEALRFDAEWRGEHTRLAAQARLWRDADNDRSFLLRGRELRAAERWLTERDEHAQPPTARHGDFVLASRRAATRRRSVVVGLALLVLVLSLALAAYALVQRSRAIEDRRVILSRGLAAQSLTLGGTDPALAAALSVEAYRIDPTREAGEAVDAALGRFGPAMGDFTGHTGAVHGVQVTPDGRTAISGGADGTLRFWDIATRAQIGAPLRARQGAINAVKLSPDGATLATGGEDGTVELWSVGSRRKLATLAGARRAVTAIAFSPGGTRLAEVSLDGTSRIWDVKRRALAADTKVGRGDTGLESVAYSDLQLATGSQDGFVQFRDNESNAPLGDPLRVGKGAVWGLAFAERGTVLATGGEDRIVRLWDVAARKPIPQPMDGSVGRVRGVSFTSDLKTLISASRTGAQRWSVRERARVGPPLASRSFSTAFDTAFGRDEKTLISANADTTLKLWNLTDAPPVVEIYAPLGPRDPMLALPSPFALRPDGRMLAVTFGTSVVQVPLDPRQRPGTELPVGRAFISGLVYDGTGQHLLALDEAGTFRSWNAVTGKLEISTPSKRTWTSLALGPDGRAVIGADSDGQVLSTAKLDKEPFTVKDDPVIRGTLSPTGETLATDVLGGGIRLWDVAAHRQLGTVASAATGTGTVRARAFSPDGTLLAVAGSAGTVVLWDVATQRRVGKVLAGHTGDVSGMAFTRDNATFASGSSQDGTIRLWDVATGRPLGAPLQAPDGSGDALVFTPNGRQLVSMSGAAHTVWRWDSVLWSRDPNARRDRLCGLAQRNLSRAEWRRYLPDEPYRPTCVRP